MRENELSDEIFFDLIKVDQSKLDVFFDRYKPLIEKRIRQGSYGLSIEDIVGKVRHKVFRWILKQERFEVGKFIAYLEKVIRTTIVDEARHWLKVPKSSQSKGVADIQDSAHATKAPRLQAVPNSMDFLQSVAVQPNSSEVECADLVDFLVHGLSKRNEIIFRLTMDRFTLEEIGNHPDVDLSAPRVYRCLQETLAHLRKKYESRFGTP